MDKIPNETIPIKFNLDGVLYQGYFSPLVSITGYSFHIYIDHYYRGNLHFNAIDQTWRLESQSFKALNDLTDFFGEYIIQWIE